MGLKNVKAFCKDNANTIFTVLGIACTAAAMITTAHSTVKACKKIEDAEYDKWSDMGEPEDPDVDISLTAGETAKLVWADYIPPVILFGGAVTFEILALRAGQKKIDALAGACMVATQTVNTIRESMRDNLPAKDVRKVESDVIHRVVEEDKKNPKIANKIDDLYSKTEGKVIYRDSYSPAGCGIYLNGNMEQFRRAVHLFNGYLEKYQTATLNDWYDCLARTGINIGHSDMGDVLEFQYDSTPMELCTYYDHFNPDDEERHVCAIGLRRFDSSNDRGSLQWPSTPHGRY